jgi:OOP family OmpA-OmpF porin
MEITKRILLASALALCGVFTNYAYAEPRSVNLQTSNVQEPTGETYKSSAQVRAPLSRVIFYRPVQSGGLGAAGLEINGHYHTSLQMGSFAELCMDAPAKVALSLRFVRTGELVKNVRDGAVEISLKPGQESYVKLSDLGSGRETFQVVEANIAKTELRQASRQTHAVSRVPNALSCEQTQGAQARPVIAFTQIEVITLGADALFAFGKSDAQSISPDGKDELDKLIMRLQTRYGTLDKKQIQIVGYADPLGTDASNKRLSAARALTIKNYMIAGGIAGNKITSEGRGSASPIVANWHRTHVA